ncbi:MAG: NDP-sugar synthase, partial [Candidatus Bathyarchaeia archaeon]
MKAVVLSGGEGTRLRPLTSTRPKPMMKVAGSPMLLHAVNLLKSHGLTDLHITLHYMADSVKEYLTDGSPFGVKIAYSVEEYPLGTAGSVKKIQSELDGTFIVTSGDVLTDVDLSRIISFHKAKDATATIAVKSVENPLQFGIVLT